MLGVELVGAPAVDDYGAPIHVVGSLFGMTDSSWRSQFKQSSVKGFIESAPASLRWPVSTSGDRLARSRLIPRRGGENEDEEGIEK